MMGESEEIRRELENHADVAIRTPHKKTKDETKETKFVDNKRDGR